MYAVSQRFLDTVRGSHRAITRVRLCSTVQFGADPVGVDLPLLDGDIRFTPTADITATMAATVPGIYWDLVQPYGAELFAQRGVDFGDGTSELVPLGYYRIDDADQQAAPNGPIVLSTSNRVAQLQQNRIVYPRQILAGTTHRAVFELLVNGSADGQGTFGMYSRNPTVPIVWTGAGYDPDAHAIGADVVVDDSSYDFLAKLADAQGAVITALPTGELAVVAREPDPDAAPVYRITEGVNGTLVRSSRRSSRDGVYNVVRAIGSAPESPTGYRLAFITEATSPIRFNGPFGPSARYYASPVLKTPEAADEAAVTILAKSTGLPVSSSVLTVPNPALQGFDVLEVVSGGVSAIVIADEIGLPLVGQEPLTVKARTANPVTDIETTPPDPAPPDPEDPSGGGTGDPGGGGVDPGADPADGTQVAVLRSWGAVIDGDEFNYTGRPSAKWGLYDGEGHGGNGRRTPDAFSVHDGIMTVHGDGNGNSGGTAFDRGDYGYRIEVRARVYNTANDGGDRYHPVLILWPDSDQWPAGAEYDYFETDEGSDGADIFMHLPNHTPYRQDHEAIDVDITAWHNYACEWNPAAQTLRQWTDGVQQYDGTGRVAQAPGPMHPTIQLDNFGGDPRSANFDIAWVRIYAKPNA